MENSQMTETMQIEAHGIDEATHLAADIVKAYVAHNNIGKDDLPDLVPAVRTALLQADQALKKKDNQQAPAVPIKKSVTPDYLICLEDGRSLKLLKRHLRTAYDMTPEEYRAKWGLPPDYPMVAPNYAKRRSDFARQIGLGRKAGD
jgi:predicted transcriptional regulator